MLKFEFAIVNLPFDGFYESVYFGEIDREERQFIEYHCDTQNGEAGEDYEGFWPDELRMTESEYQNIMFDVTDYDACYQKIAEWYVAAFDHCAGDALKINRKVRSKDYNFDTKTYTSKSYVRPSLCMEFESMDSPREYNFTTDRVYAHVPLPVIRLLFGKSAEDNHATLAKVVRERFTSRDGFISGYDNTLDEWLAKPLNQWDHNELGTLLIAVLRLAGSDPKDSEFRDSVYYATISDSGSDEAWSHGVDWEKFEKKRLELRAEKLESWLEQDNESVMAWRKHNFERFESLIAAQPDLFKTLEIPTNGTPRRDQTPDMFA